jgi:hypothetical protein
MNQDYTKKDIGEKTIEELLKTENLKKKSPSEINFISLIINIGKRFVEKPLNSKEISLENLVNCYFIPDFSNSNLIKEKMESAIKDRKNELKSLPLKSLKKATEIPFIKENPKLSKTLENQIKLLENSEKL